MTTMAMRCVECGEPVRSGRLSCPACGALLASVSRPNESMAPGERPADAAADRIDPAPAAAVGLETDLSRGPLSWPPPEPAEPRLVARSYGRGGQAAVGESGQIAPLPGAYLPPGLAMSTATAGAAGRASVTLGGGGHGGSVDATATARLGTLPTIDAPRLVDVAGWFVVVGSALAVLGLLLPWSVVVIGARGVGGYLDDWGMASPTHILVLLVLLVVLALGVVRTAVPAWLRTGVLGLGVGGLLIGLVWPYLIGPLGADIGVLVTTLGGCALVIGGVVASWATRHVEADPLV